MSSGFSTENKSLYINIVRNLLSKVNNTNIYEFFEEGYNEA
jgi:hypothetical protein